MLKFWNIEKIFKAVKKLYFKMFITSTPPRKCFESLQTLFARVQLREKVLDSLTLLLFPLIDREVWQFSCKCICGKPEMLGIGSQSRISYCTNWFRIIIFVPSSEFPSSKLETKIAVTSSSFDYYLAPVLTSPRWVKWTRTERASGKGLSGSTFKSYKIFICTSSLSLSLSPSLINYTPS